MTTDSFHRFWQTDLTRNGLLSLLPTEDLQNLRYVCEDFAADVSPTLFSSVTARFNTNTFSRQARMQALERIGHHIRDFTFHMVHDDASFLPPLVAPDTLEEVTFVYEPQTRTSRPTSSASSSASSESKYGSWELGDLLIKHYPPIFHAASNIPAFRRAFDAMPALRVLRISCPGQAEDQRYRRDAVDYALMSIRVAIEQANPPALRTLVLDPIHPAACLALRPQLSVGSSPCSTRVWRKITTLRIGMDSFTCNHNVPSDHLKVLHTHLANFTSLEHFEFRWLGDKCPSPLSLDTELATSRPSSFESLITCPSSSTTGSCKPIKFKRLKTMRLVNAVLDSSQAAAFIASHRKVLNEIDFQHCDLRSGTWNEALAPLSRISGNEDWKEKQRAVEVMEVPLVLRPVEEKTEIECIRTILWADCDNRNNGMQAFKMLTSRTRSLLPSHVKRLFKRSKAGWHPPWRL